MNQIWDKWWEAIINNMKLKNWVILNLYANSFSQDMVSKLKEWEKFWQEKWVDCAVNL